MPPRKRRGLAEISLRCRRYRPNSSTFFNGMLQYFSLTRCPTFDCRLALVRKTFNHPRILPAPVPHSCCAAFPSLAIASPRFRDTGSVASTGCIRRPGPSGVARNIDGVQRQRLLHGRARTLPLPQPTRAAPPPGPVPPLSCSIKTLPQGGPDRDPIQRALQEIWMAETKKDALAAFDAFIETWGVKYDKAVECLIKDRDA